MKIIIKCKKRRKKINKSESKIISINKKRATKIIITELLFGWMSMSAYLTYKKNICWFPTRKL